MVRILSDDQAMETPNQGQQDSSSVPPEALKLLGSFARFVQEKDPRLAGQLAPVAMEWAQHTGIDQGQLVNAILHPSE